MRKKNTTLILLIAIVVSLAACTTPKQPKYYINATLKDFFNYKPGSYWVFYDSVGNIFDSLYVKQKLDYLPYATSTTDGNEYIYIYIIGDSAFKGLEIDLKDVNASLNYEDTAYFSDKLINVVPFNKMPSNVLGYTCTFYNEYIIEGISYSNVYKVICNADIFYINYDKGFIKLQLNNTPDKKTYNLIRGQIMR